MKKPVLTAVAFAFLATVGSAQAATLDSAFALAAVNAATVDSAQTEAAPETFTAENLLGSALSDPFTDIGKLQFSPGGTVLDTIILPTIAE